VRLSHPVLDCGSSNASSPTSTRSYTEVYPYAASALSSTVKTILHSRGESDRDDALYARAQRHLQALNDPRYSEHDTPPWVTRYALSQKFT
ncbi:hypothetical protein BD309DRAFT_1009476, partial [Dichomitus squalens]